MEENPARPDHARRTVTVRGSAGAVVVPDVAQVEISVDAHAAQPAEAYAQGNVIAGQVLAALDVQEVPESDRRTTAIALGPHYKPGAHVPTGFTATHSLAIRIADLERVPGVLAGLVSAAGEALRLGNFTLSSSDTAGAQARAETAALADAHQRAQRLAEAAGATLGAVQTIRHEPPGGGRYATTMGWTAQSAAPLQPGSDTITVELTVTYALTPSAEP